MNLLTAIDPALALLNTSPYYLGEGGEFSARAERIHLSEYPELRGLSNQAIESGLESTAGKSSLRKMGSDPTEYRPVAPKLDGSSTISEL